MARTDSQYGSSGGGGGAMAAVAGIVLVAAIAGGYFYFVDGSPQQVVVLPSPPVPDPEPVPAPVVPDPVEEPDNLDRESARAAVEAALSERRYADAAKALEGEKDDGELTDRLSKAMWDDFRRVDKEGTRLEGEKQFTEAAVLYDEARERFRGTRHEKRLGELRAQAMSLAKIDALPVRRRSNPEEPEPVVVAPTPPPAPKPVVMSKPEPKPVEPAPAPVAKATLEPAPKSKAEPKPKRKPIFGARTSRSKTSIPKAPPRLNPRVLVLTAVGGPGDQWIQEVGFTPDGAVYGVGGGKTFTVGYPDGGRREGKILGNPNEASTGKKGIEYAVRKTVKGPFDGKTWNYGYRQVAGLLQQPFLDSPNDWKWFGWSEEQEGGLRADSRGVQLIFPSRDRFIFHVWRDGGNSTITRDPRDLSKKNTWCHRGGGSASYLLMGDAATGEPLAGAAYAHRPHQVVSDPWGRVYVTQALEGRPDHFKVNGADPCGVSILDADLKPLISGTFGPKGNTYAIAVKNDLLVIGGEIDSSEPPPQFVNPVQAKPGGGRDGLLVILKLW